MSYEFPKINGVSADARISQRTILNYLQGDSERDGKGVYSGYSDDELHGAVIRIAKPDILPINPRKLGATLNGGHYSGSVITISNEEYEVEVLDAYDTVINVPYVALDMVPELKESEWANQIGKALFIMKNGLCLANKVYQSFYKDEKNANVVKFDKSKATEATANFRACLDDAEDLLNEGDIEHGIDIFPEDTRRITYVNGITKYIRAVGSFVTGGSNFAQEMLRSGAYSPDDTKNTLEDGYHGTYGNTEMNLLSNMKLAMADSYLGLPAGTIRASGIEAVNSSAVANVFALSDNGVVDGEFPFGRGRLLKPLYRMGASTLFTKGNAFIVDSEFVNPFKIFTTLGIEPKVLAKGSRPIDLGAEISAISTSGATVVAKETSYDRSGNKVEETADIEKVAYVMSDSVIEDVCAFATAYEKASVKGTATTGTITATLTKGKYLAVVVLGKESTVSSVACKVIA